MKRFLMAVALTLPIFAFASTTYSRVALADGSFRPRSVKAVATTGSESAPSAATEGMDLTTVGAVDVIVCADSGQTITAGGTIQVWFYDVDVGLWALSDYSLSVPTTKRCATTLGPSAGKGIPIIAKRGRIALVPSGMTVSSGGLTLYHLATQAGVGANGGAL
jgi:hypothetical protein